MEKIKLMIILPWTYPKNIKDNIVGFFKSIRNFYYRGRYGIAPNWDTWDLDSYMLEVFKNGLENFRKGACGHPAQITMEEWDNVLAHMEKLIKIIETDGLDCCAAEFFWEKQKNMSKDEWNKQYNESWWGAVKEWEEYRQDCMDELCDLMKEYFHHLWW